MSAVAPRRTGGGLSGLTGSQIPLLIVAAMLMILAVAVVTGAVPWFSAPPPPPSTDGLVPVPTVGRRVLAYARVTRDDIWDTRNGRLAVVYLPPESVTPEMLTRVQDVVGRVLSHDKQPGYVFTEADFLPKGSRDGLVGGIPPGQRAMRIPAERVQGLHGLHLGDRFDLVATLPIDAGRNGASPSMGFSGPYGQQMALEARLSNWQKQATVRVLVQNGLIVQPMGPRVEEQVQNSLGQGASVRTRAIQEAVIAVAPEEVARLTEAMVVQALITAVPRSGQPEEDMVDTPDLQPSSPFSTLGGPADDGSFRTVETIMGRTREMAAVPRR